MPIDLKKIPEKLVLPVPPDKLKWLLIIVLCIISGATFVFLFWHENESTHSIWFWFCSLVVPLFIGLTGYIARLRRYENERDRIVWWNHLHEQQYDEQVALGRLAMGVLATAHITPVASNKLAHALTQGGSELQMNYSPQHRRMLTTAFISPQLTESTESGYLLRIENLLKNITRQLQPELTEFSGNFHVRIQHDGVLDNEVINMLWHQVFPLPCDEQSFEICKEGDGAMWIDKWLDSQESILILSVAINLFLEPRDKQAESISAILLASPAWLSQKKVTPKSWVHRPVIMEDPVESVTTVTRWGNVMPELPWYFWRSRIQSDALPLTLQSMEQGGYLLSKKGEFVLDNTFGESGVGVGNIMLICASENAVKLNMTQWLLIDDKTTHMLIVRTA